MLINPIFITAPPQINYTYVRKLLFIFISLLTVDNINGILTEYHWTSTAGNLNLSGDPTRAKVYK
jgi:hypothetical protein